MTHPEETPEVVDAPIVDAEVTIEDRLNAALTEAPEQDEETPEAEAPEAEDEPEIEDEDIDPELPAIEAPNSLTAEEKEAFKSLPREGQEMMARRIGELEKGFQSKAQEAAQAQRAARTEALQQAAQVEAQAADILSQYAQQFAVNPPDPSLIASDPHSYAQQLAAYQHYTAQGQQAQRDAENAKARHAEYTSALQAQEAQQFHERLQSDFPEMLDPTSGPKIKADLTATAKAMGYGDELIFNASADDILALRTAQEWRSKAEKYDKAMSRKMERVRSGKSPPPIAKPGVAKPAGERSNAAYQSDREAMRRGDKDAELRVLRHFIND